MKTQGKWLYTHQDAGLLLKIKQGTWKPEANKGTKYGCGIYLSRTPWYDDATHALQCEIVLPDEQVVDTFDPAPEWESEGAGSTERHFGRYIQQMKLCAGNRTPTSEGNSQLNVKIRDHFLQRSIRAVMFREHDKDVIVVFDPTAIRIEGLLELGTGTLTA